MKTHLIVLFTLLSFVTCKAQYVTIPDTAFANLLANHDFFKYCINGNQFDTTCSELIYDNSLDILGDSIEDISGIEYFWHIKFLGMTGTKVRSIRGLPRNLIMFVCSINELDSLPSLPHTLTSLLCDGNNLKQLPDLPPNLLTLWCFSNDLRSIPELPDSVSSLIVGGNPNLKCLPLLTRVRRLDFTQTSVTCIPNLGNVHESNPPLNSLPLCTTSNPDNCQTYVGISEAVELNIAIYPNPSTSRFTLISDRNIQSVSVYNTSGRLILSQNNLGISAELNVSEAGMYIVEVITSAGNAYKKVLIQE